MDAELSLPSDLDNDLAYQFALRLTDNVLLEILLFNRVEHRWIFSHRYIEGNEGRFGEDDLLNTTRLIVDYTHGVAQSCTVTMEIVWPARRGRLIFAGVDISPRSKFFLELKYKMLKKENKRWFQLSEVVITPGQHKILLNDVKPALMFPINLPFPIKDVIELECGGKFEVPFTDNGGLRDHFIFPDNIRSTIG